MHGKFLGVVLLTLGSISLVRAKGGRSGGGGRISGSRSSSGSHSGSHTSSHSGSHTSSHSGSQSETADHQQSAHHSSFDPHANSAPASHPSSVSNSHVNAVPGSNPSPGFRAPQPAVMGGPTAPRYPVQYPQPQQVHYAQGAPATGYPSQYHAVPMQNNAPQRSSNVVPFGAGFVAGGIVGRSHSSHGHYSGTSRQRGGHHSSKSNATSQIDGASDNDCPSDSNSTECAFNTTGDRSDSDALKMLIDQTSASNTVQIVDQTFDVNSTNVE